jgi:hypothetical protein
MLRQSISGFRLLDVGWAARSVIFATMITIAASDNRVRVICCVAYQSGLRQALYKT